MWRITYLCWVRPTVLQQRATPGARPVLVHGQAQLHHADCFDWLESQPANSIHAVITDPPYGLVEYSDVQQRKLREGNGGVWRQPPSFDGHRRAPRPRFTTLRDVDLQRMRAFFERLGTSLSRVLVPGAHVFLASNPLVSHIAASGLAASGLENRGAVIRLVMTMRGGDRPKGAHEEFFDVSVMPRSMAEPWLLFRKPLEAASRTISANGAPAASAGSQPGSPLATSSSPGQPSRPRSALHRIPR